MHKYMLEQDIEKRYCKRCNENRLLIKFIRKNHLWKSCNYCADKYNNNYKDKFQKYYKNNKRKIQKYQQQNKQRINERQNKRYKNDLQHKIIVKTRNRLNFFLNCKSIRKDNTTIQSIGISKRLFTLWIEFNLKLDKLTNFHLDHLVPLSHFKCKSFQDVIDCKCNHWTNIIPVSPEYNLSKSDRMPTKKEKLKHNIKN